MARGRVRRNKRHAAIVGKTAKQKDAGRSARAKWEFTQACQPLNLTRPQVVALSEEDVAGYLFGRYRANGLTLEGARNIVSSVCGYLNGTKRDGKVEPDRPTIKVLRKAVTARHPDW